MLLMPKYYVSCNNTAYILLSLFFFFVQPSSPCKLAGCYYIPSHQMVSSPVPLPLCSCADTRRVSSTCAVWAYDRLASVSALVHCTRRSVFTLLPPSPWRSVSVCPLVTRGVITPLWAWLRRAPPPERDASISTISCITCSCTGGMDCSIALCLNRSGI